MAAVERMRLTGSKTKTFKIDFQQEENTRFHSHKALGLRKND